MNPSPTTYRILLKGLVDNGKLEKALEMKEEEHYKQFTNKSPVNPSPTTYRILLKGLVDNGKLEKALEMKEEMAEKRFGS